MHCTAHLRHSVRLAISTTLAGMDSSELTPEQCRIIGDRLAPIQRYLHALVERTRQQAFPQDDKVRQLAEQAHTAIHSLRVDFTT
jgi:hypothetical protein